MLDKNWSRSPPPSWATSLFSYDILFPCEYFIALANTLLRILYCEYFIPLRILYFPANNLLRGDANQNCQCTLGDARYVAAECT